MKGNADAWKAKYLLWQKKYKKYQDEVFTYEFETQKSYSLHNAVVFLIYGTVCYLWNKYVINESAKGAMFCWAICTLSLTDFMVCKLFLEKHIKYSAIVANIYILLLIKTIMSLDLVWNDSMGGNISWTLLLCSIIITALISIVPTHYVLIIAIMVIADTAEAVIKCEEFNGVLYNLLDSTIISVFCISINVIFSAHQYSEFSRKEELKFESNRDLLTQLYNRRYIERYYEVSSEPDQLCAMIMFDLDNFKMANDVYGHKKGDEVLCSVADILRRNFRGTDCIARLGGDEFAIYLPGISKREIVIDRVHAVLKDFPLIIDGDKKVEVSVSIGVAYKNPNEFMDYSKLCNKADEAMYMAKRLGKGRAVVSSERNTREVVIVA